MSRLIAFAIKVVAIYFIVKFGCGYIDTKIPWNHQHFAVWATIYLPLVMGYESFINVIFSLNKK